ncbi:protein O-glucosyltransferase 2-like [Topomyia yanbarensis]|uniref:protein O-glucosyltransferase 2-like n=1 Tax=Topomyia yanbarensis TaxID=2498891 RepID=UPI00273B1641|nr:protein O-glucosyltransferase 2-like [Topomyia yanbarensis]XP_058815636.1 protein O-glucosyltransferase 2-like [Topomyia yanbarensis]
MRKCIILFCIFVCIVLVNSKPHVNKSRIWGPGIEFADKLPMNARYFFIELKDIEDKLITEPVKYDIRLKGRSRIGNCRVRIEQIDRYDGTALIRYKLMETCWDVEISVLFEDQHLGDSPYNFDGKLYIENCNCPQGTLDQWLQLIDCPVNDPQIDNDLIPFRAVNFSNLRPRIIEQYDKPGSVSLCNYVVKNNLVYRTCYGRYTGFKIYMDAMLLSLARKALLPDVELFVNLGDYPLVTKGGHRRTTGPYPIFSWCGSDDTFDIVMPTYDIVESTLEAMSRVSLDMLSVQRKGVSWEQKIPKAFWRGRDACRERLDLVGISQKHSDLINASLTNFFFFRDEEEVYGPKVAHISFFEFFDYRYQINVDGTVAAYRFPYLLGGTSVVFKQDSKYYEHFYSKLKKWREYVPFDKNLSNLVETIEKAKESDDDMLLIRDNAKIFAEQHLLPKSILCYSALLLRDYAKNIVSPIQILPGMELAEQPALSSNCECDFKDHAENHDEL